MREIYRRELARGGKLSGKEVASACGDVRLQSVVESGCTAFQSPRWSCLESARPAFLDFTAGMTFLCLAEVQEDVERKCTSGLGLGGLEVFLEPDLVRHIIELGTFVRYPTGDLC
jgi:hypothetical protein